MSFTINQTKSYSESLDVVTTAALGAIEGLEGKIESQESADNKNTVAVKFHKTVLGKVLGDRTHMDLVLSNDGDQTNVDVSVYPLDAIGRKLMFGARKGVSQTIVQWFTAHLEHRLPK